MAEEDEDFTTVRETRAEALRVSRRTFRGKEQIHVRVYYVNKDDEWMPTKKGVTLSDEDVPKLIDALRAHARGSSA